MANNYDTPASFLNQRLSIPDRNMLVDKRLFLGVDLCVHKGGETKIPAATRNNGRLRGDCCSTYYHANKRMR